MRPFAFILLLLHINFSMFIAQVDEQDIYDASGQQVPDIDTLTDWLQVTFLSNDKSSSHQNDKDDDNARYFHLLKPHHFFSPHFERIKKPAPIERTCFAPVVDDAGLAAGFSSIQLPPPKA